jgi:hypothetical protein
MITTKEKLAELFSNKTVLTVEVANSFTLEDEPQPCDFVTLKTFSPSSFFYVTKKGRTAVNYDNLNTAAFDFYNDIKRTIGINGIVVLGKITRGGKVKIILQNKSFK